MTVSRIARVALLALAAGLGFQVPAGATTVLPLYLDEIVTQATTAFEGTCVDNRVERDEATGLVVTYTTFAVTEVLKGNVGTPHVIKQVGGQLPGEEHAHNPIRGVPRFQPGEEYVVFLAGVSAAGFSSPIGLSQGRFNVHRQDGKRKVSNGRDFKDLAATVPAAGMPPAVADRLQRTPGAVRELDIDDFKALVKQRRDGGRR